ncbi:MAG: DUF2087 domain-containing protein [Nitriliruptorales bacterium]|nr:DUF2087 domain-containing protein [Nitriliruptorales bacterium]
MDDPIRFFKLLLDPDRLAVAGAVATVDRTVDEVAEHTALQRRTVLETLAAMVDIGVVFERGGSYRVDHEVLVDLAQRLPQPAPPDGAVFRGMTDAEREILARFFRGERLIEIPASRSKRLVILERIALEFEPGRRYREPEVNELVGRFHEDHASLRRYLVDEGLLDREPVESNGGGTGVEYWRAGGRVLTYDEPDQQRATSQRQDDM